MKMSHEFSLIKQKQAQLNEEYLKQELVDLIQANPYRTINNFTQKIGHMPSWDKEELADSIKKVLRGLGIKQSKTSVLCFYNQTAEEFEPVADQTILESYTELTSQYSNKMDLMDATHELMLKKYNIFTTFLRKWELPNDRTK